MAQLLSGTDPADNLRLVREYTGRAADAGAQLVVFPEATMCRFGVPLTSIAEPVDGPWADGVRRLAADAGIAVVVDMFTPADDDRVFNTLLGRPAPRINSTAITTKFTSTTRSGSPNRAPSHPVTSR